MGDRVSGGSPARRPRSAALAAAIAGALIALAPSPRPAAAEPSTGALVGVGLALSLPTYAIGVSLHEGSHALAAKLVGAQVLSISVLPGRDSTGAFHFGLTRVRGLSSPAEKHFFYLAPKLTDTLLLAGFSGLVLTDAWPENRYGQLALTVFATGLWVDFTKDVISFSPANDIVKVMTLAGLKTEWQRLPVRLGYAAISAALAYSVVRGYQRTFDDEPSSSAPRLLLPVLSARF
jgi:hypothetical protein